MIEAKIKSKTGAVITIKGTKEEVSSVISQFERSAVVNNIKRTQSKKDIIKKGQKKRSTASELIIELKKEGFFDKPKSLLDVVIELEEKGYIYPATTLSGIMINFVQKKLLGRKKIDRKWVYGK